MATHDSSRAPPPHRRLVLRKIDQSAPTAAPLPPVRPPLPSISSFSNPPRRGAALAAGSGRLESGAAPGAVGVSRKLVFPQSGATGSADPPPASPNSVDSSPALSQFPSPARASLPPVVATVGVERVSTPRSASGQVTSRYKAGLLGGAAGLALVGLVVLGVRQVAGHPETAKTTASSIASAASKPVASAPPVISVAPVTIPMHPMTTSEKPVAPPSHEPPHRPKPAALVPGIQRPIARAVEAPSQGATSAGSSTPAASSVAADKTAPADSAASLVPVIPPSPPPEIDPLVKAVLEDNDPHR